MMLAIGAAVLAGRDVLQAGARSPSSSAPSYSMVVRSSGQCLNIVGGSTDAGAATEQNICDGRASERFSPVQNANGTWAIRNANSALCLDSGASTTSGAAVVQAACGSSVSQRWNLRSLADGSYSFVTHDGQGCINVFQGASWAGAPVITWACLGGSNEKFDVAGFYGRYQLPPSSGNSALVAGMVSHNLDAGSLGGIQQSGAKSLRTPFYWSEVEAVCGQYKIPSATSALVSNELALGITPQALLFYNNACYDGGSYPQSSAGIQAYADYAAYVAAQAPQAQYFEIYNEWTNFADRSGLSNAQQSYMDLLEVAGPAVKTARSSAIVLADEAVLGDKSPEPMQKLAAAGAFAWFDGLVLHPYVYQGYPQGTSPEAFRAYLQEIENKVAMAAGKSVDIYVTEAGWPVGGIGGKVTEDLQASYSSRMYILARTLPFLKMLELYEYRDSCTDASSPECHFGLLRADGSVRPAGYAYRDTLPFLDGRQYVSQLVSAKPSVMALEFVDAAGVRSIAIWSADDLTYKVTLTTSRAVRSGQVQIVTVGAGSTTVPASSRLDLTVTARPMLITGFVSSTATVQVQ